MKETQTRADQVVFITTEETLNIGVKQVDRINAIPLKENKSKSEHVVYNKTEELLNIGIDKKDKEMILTSVEINKNKDHEQIIMKKSDFQGIAPYHMSDAKITKPSEEKPSLRKFLFEKVKGTTGDTEKKSSNKGSKESLTKESETRN